MLHNQKAQPNRLCLLSFSSNPRSALPAYCPAALKVAICIIHGPLAFKGAVAL